MTTSSSPDAPETAPTMPSFNAVEAYTFYERVRHRLPKAEFPDKSEHVSDILSICDVADLFVFDAYGVLNVGELPVPGAAAQIQTLRKLGKEVAVLTNGASFNSQASFEKFRKLGFDFSLEEIFSSRHASEQAITGVPATIPCKADGAELLWGVVVRDDFNQDDLPFPTLVLGDDSAAYDRVDAFLFLSSSLWSNQRQQYLQNSLTAQPRRIVIANPDVVAPHGTNFSTEPGFFGHSLADELKIEVEFHGKPFPSVFELVEQQHSHIDPARMCMVGDTLHTDTLGGSSRGWQTLLVADHGLFAGMQIDDFIASCGITPHFIVPTI